MRRTVITHPDGTVTTITSRWACGCGGFFTTLAILFLIALPLEWPLPLMIVAYAFLTGVIGLAMYGTYLKKAKTQTCKHPPAPPMPPPL